MITRRDFIKGIGAAAAAVVLPKAKVVEPELGTLFGKPMVWANINDAPEGEIVLEQLVTGVDWGAGDDRTVVGIYATDEMLEDSLFTADELLEMASQPSVPLTTRIGYKASVQTEYDKYGQEFVEMGYVRAKYEVRGLDDRLICVSSIHADFIEDQQIVDAMLRNMDEQAEWEARERLGLND